MAGTLSDTMGRRNLMLFGLALFAVVPFLYSVATNPWVPVLAMMASGLAISIYFPPSEAYASSLFLPEKAGEAMGRYHMSWAVSSVIGPSVSGFLVSQAATMEAMPPKDRGTATGVCGMVMSLGGTLGMFVMSGVLAFYSIDMVFYTCAWFTLVAALVVVAMRGYFN